MTKSPKNHEISHLTDPSCFYKEVSNGTGTIWKGKNIGSDNFEISIGYLYKKLRRLANR